jgi:hypothetical protein
MRKRWKPFPTIVPTQTQGAPLYPHFTLELTLLFDLIFALDLILILDPILDPILDRTMPMRICPPDPSHSR